MKSFSQKGILIAFGEWFLKSEGVKNLFQKRLMENLRFFLSKEKIKFRLSYSRERIFIETERCSQASAVIKSIFGIGWLAESFLLPGANLKKLSGFVAANYEDWIEKDRTFAIRLRMERGVFKESREKVIEKIADKIDREVDLDYPDREVFIEIRRGAAFIYFEKIRGANGLPVGSSGKVLTLMSGGIDSPVAAYLIAKRGAENIWLHFHSFPLVSNKSIEKTKELARVFLKYQPNLTVYYAPFSKIQMEIKAKIPEQYRILLYRRLMLKIAEEIAGKRDCAALVTGESLGQVSSQTLPNMEITEEAVKIPVLRPLVAYDKEEIISLAKKINAYEISIKPQEDCCTLFTPKHPTAAGEMAKIKELEKKIASKKLIAAVIKEIKMERY